MASKIDLSLDELVQLKKAKRGYQQKPGQQQGAKTFQKFGQQQGARKFQKFGQQQGAGKFQKFGQQQGGGKFQKFGKEQGYETFQRPGQQQRDQKGSVSDLRDVLAKKQKTTVTDLRAKLTPKAAPAPKGKPTPPFRRQPQSGGPPARARTRSQPRPRSPPFMVPASKRRSDPSPSKPIAQRYRDPPIHLPSYSETKKITITVPGLNRPVSEPYTPSTYRREEHLAAAIARSKEARQDSYMRGREEFLASAITSAIGMTSPTAPERERGSVGGYQRLRGYSRSPSPPLMDIGYESQFPSIPRSSSLGGARPKALTTMTTMSISNLSDTVSKNDVAELCSAVGPLEGIHMVAPGVADVVFKYKDDALEAFKKYNQRNLDGQPMICRLQAASRARMSSSGYGGRGLGDSYGDDFYPHSSGFY